MYYYANNKNARQVGAIQMKCLYCINTLLQIVPKKRSESKKNSQFRNVFYQVQEFKCNKTQWAKIWQKVQFSETTLFVSKAKVNSFWKKLIVVAPKGECGVKKKFQKTMILAFEV